MSLHEASQPREMLSQSLSRRELIKRAALGSATIAAAPFIVPHPVEIALRQITPVPGEKVEFHAYFEGFHRLRKDNPLYDAAYRPMTYEPQPFTQTLPDKKHPFGILGITTEQDNTSFDLILPSAPTDNVSLHPLLVRIDDQKEEYVFPLVQSLRPSRQHMRLALDQGSHKVTISPLSGDLDYTALRSPELSIPRGTPLQVALQNMLPVFNVRPDLLNHPTKDVLLFAFTTLHVNHAGILAIEQHAVASSEESNLSKEELEELFGRTIDFETIEIRKTRYDPQTGQIDEKMLQDTAIIQVRGHTWLEQENTSNIDQITETDTVAGPTQLTHRGLAPSLTIPPPHWNNLDLVNANPEMQILGFREEAHKRDLFFRRLPQASQKADSLLAKLRQNPQGVYPTTS